MSTDRQVLDYNDAINLKRFTLGICGVSASYSPTEFNNRIKKSGLVGKTDDVAAMALSKKLIDRHDIYLNQYDYISIESRVVSSGETVYDLELVRA